MTDERRTVLYSVALIIGFALTLGLLFGDFHESESEAVRTAAAVVAGVLIVLGVAVGVVLWQRGRRRDELTFLLATFFFVTRGLETWADLTREGTLHDVLEVAAGVPSIAVISGIVFLGVRWLRARGARA